MIETIPFIGYGFSLGKNYILNDLDLLPNYERHWSCSWDELYAFKKANIICSSPYERCSKNYEINTVVEEGNVQLWRSGYFSDKTDLKTNQKELEAIVLATNSVLWTTGTAKMATRSGRDWDAQIQEFCQIMKIPYQNPYWLLSSYTSDLD